MNSNARIPKKLETAIACLLVVFCCVLAVFALKKIQSLEERLVRRGWMQADAAHPFEQPDFAALEGSKKSTQVVRNSNMEAQGLFSSELRVAAIGSAYPIPYEAEVCPFSGIPQPAVNQLDYDDDGITDDWEIAEGLDRFNAADARLDPDGDGFINREEFQYRTKPFDAQSHPPYALKMRFNEKKNVSFPIVFQGTSRVSEDELIFQLNTLSDGGTYFRALGEVLEGVVLKNYIPPKDGRAPRLVVDREGVEIDLIKGEIIADPESEIELINILDQTTKIVTMGALLSLRSDEYRVLSVSEDQVILKCEKTGKVFSITKMSAKEQAR